jgi:hypothetical protein
MKIRNYWIVLILFAMGLSNAIAQPVLHSIAELKMSLAFTDKSGTNGAAVAFNPSEKVYYAVMAGSEEFPLEKFDIFGNSIISAKAGIDVRGMWWNPKTKSLEMNAYGDYGYYKIELKENGDPMGIASKLVFGQNQPSEQSSAAFDPVKQQLFFYDNGVIYTYSLKSGKVRKKRLSLDIQADIVNINSTSMIFTGIKGLEYGVLNYVDGELLLFDKKHGKHSGTVNFIHNAPLSNALRFSYANKLVWLFNAEYGIWYGYEIFE